MILYDISWRVLKNKNDFNTIQVLGTVDYKLIKDYPLI